MSWRKTISISIVAVLLMLAAPLNVLGDSITSMEKEEARVQKEGEAINKEIDSVVETINKKYKALAKIEEEIAKSEETIKKTEEDIQNTTESIEKRSGVMASRLQDIQIRQKSSSSLQVLLEAESFSDFMNRAYAVRVLQSAEREKVESLYSDKEKLAKLQETLADTQKTLVKKQEVAKAEKNQLDTEVVGLQDKLASNKKVLADLTARRLAEAERLEAEKKAEIEKKAKAKEEEQLVVSAAENSEPQNVVNNKQPQTTAPKPSPQPTPPISSGGSTSGQATAYVATGNKTATGTVPAVGRTIAVDRGVIPLGARVQIIVPSMPAYSGVYTAEDTGGAVQGNIIDIFVGSEGEARLFGRRAIFFTVLG